MWHSGAVDSVNVPRRLTTECVGVEGKAKVDYECVEERDSGLCGRVWRWMVDCVDV